MLPPNGGGARAGASMKKTLRGLEQRRSTRAELLEQRC
jgi:hypothetical protein